MEANVASDRTLAANGLLNRPLYLQVRDALIQRIVNGEWKPGAGIPNETDLARDFEISVGTVRRALETLEGEHVLTRKQGRGTFVNDQTRDAFVSRFQSIRTQDGKPLIGDSRTIDVVEAPANDDERRCLDLGAHEPVYRVRRVHLYEGRPFMAEKLSLPVGLFPGLLEKGIEHPIVVLAQRYGIFLGRGNERISIAPTPAGIANTLGVAPNAPVLLLDRLLLTVDGRPVEWRVTHLNMASGFYLAEMT